MKITLHYIHDPMCSWCWGFAPVWAAIQRELPEKIKVNYVLGGLAPDSHEPMDVHTQQMIQANWRRIEQVIPGTHFNDAFWETCQPRRSTYPACRAVLAAKKQNPSAEKNMIAAIQSAYYLHAKNPSDDAVLIELAGSIGLDITQFTDDLNSGVIQQQLLSDINAYHNLSQRSGASGFPSLVLDVNDVALAVPRNYLDAAATVSWIDQRIDTL